MVPTVGSPFPLLPAPRSPALLQMCITPKAGYTELSVRLGVDRGSPATSDLPEIESNVPGC
jgi:hypothetical protein